MVEPYTFASDTRSNYPELSRNWRVKIRLTILLCCKLEMQKCRNAGMFRYPRCKSARKPAGYEPKLGWMCFQRNFWSGKFAFHCKGAHTKKILHTGVAELSGIASANSKCFWIGWSRLWNWVCQGIDGKTIKAPTLCRHHTGPSIQKICKCKAHQGWFAVGEIGAFLGQAN